MILFLIKSPRSLTATQMHIDDLPVLDSSNSSREGGSERAATIDDRRADITRQSNPPRDEKDPPELLEDLYSHDLRRGSSSQHHSSLTTKRRTRSYDISRRYRSSSLDPKRYADLDASLDGQGLLDLNHHSPAAVSSQLQRELNSRESVYLSPRTAREVPRPSPWKWAYGSGVIVGRFQQWLFGGRRLKAEEAIANPLHIGVIGHDIGVYGHVRLQDYLGYNPPKTVPPETTGGRPPPSGGWFSGFSKVASRLVGIGAVILLGMVAGFTYYRPTLYIEADVSSVALFSKLHFSRVNNSRVKITGSLQFELAVTNPSYLPQQLLLHGGGGTGPNLTASSDDPFNDTSHGAYVIGLLVPYSTSNASLYQPLGFATPATTTVPLISPRDSVTHVAYNLTVRLDSEDKQDGFAIHLAKPLTQASSDDLIIECGDTTGTATNSSSIRHSDTYDQALGDEQFVPRRTQARRSQRRSQKRVDDVVQGYHLTTGGSDGGGGIYNNDGLFIKQVITRWLDSRQRMRIIKSTSDKSSSTVVMRSMSSTPMTTRGMTTSMSRMMMMTPPTSDCQTILDLYLDQCQMGFVLIEAAIMHLTYQFLAGGVYTQLFRTNPFPVPCEISTTNETTSSA